MKERDDPGKVSKSTSGSMVVSHEYEDEGIRGGGLEVRGSVYVMALTSPGRQDSGDDATIPTSLCQLRRRGSWGAIIEQEVPARIGSCSSGSGKPANPRPATIFGTDSNLLYDEPSNLDCV